MQSVQNFSLDNFFSKIRLPCESFFDSCAFAGSKFNCCQQVLPTFNNMGGCFTIGRFKKALFKFKQRLPGPGGGLFVRFRLPLNKTFMVRSGTMNVKGMVITAVGGFQPVLIDPIVAPLGKASFVKLVAYQDKRRSQCTDVVVDNILEGRIKNTPNSCKYIKFLRKSERACGCMPFTFKPKITPDKICLPNITIKCVQPLFDNWFGEHGFDCLSPCDSMQYMHSLVTAEQHENRLLNHDYSIDKGSILEENIQQNKVFDEVMDVHVFFEDIEIKVTEEHLAASWSSVISSLGGQIGLWLGVSICSAVVLALDKLAACGQGAKVDVVDIEKMDYATSHDSQTMQEVVKMKRVNNLEV